MTQPRAGVSYLLERNAKALIPKTLNPKAPNPEPLNIPLGQETAARGCRALKPSRIPSAAHPACHSGLVQGVGLRVWDLRFKGLGI